MTNDAEAERRAEIWLQDLWAGRESAEFALPPSRLALTPGDVVALTVNGRRRLIEIARGRPTPKAARSRRARSIRKYSICRWHAPRRRAPALPRRSGRCMRWCSICRRSTPTSRRCWRGSRCSPIPGRGRSRSGARSTARASSASRWRWRRRSSARRSTICRPGRQPLAIMATSVRVQLYGGALASVSDHARCLPAPMRRRCSAPTAPGRCCNSPLRSWWASAPIGCRACCAARPAANGRWRAAAGRRAVRAAR